MLSVFADACSITYTTLGAEVSAVTEDKNFRFRFSSYDSVCKRLRSEKLELLILGDAGVLAERSYAWVSVHVRDPITLLTSDHSRVTTTLNDTPSSPISREILVDGINKAIEGLNLDAAIADLNVMRKQSAANQTKAAGPAGK